MDIKIPLARPDITAREIKAVSDVLRSSRLSLGPLIKKFEKKLALYVRRKYAVAISSGTSALHLTVKALGIKKGDEVITTPFSFIASANCILYEGGKPVFVDIDENTLNIDTTKIEKAITNKTKAFLIVDIFGHPAHWENILKIARSNKIKVIEDSCEALGSEYRGVRCGSFGDAATFAFYPNKQLTTGEGGMIVTDSKRLAEECRSMSNQGRRAMKGQWLEHVRIGYNYRMDEMSAALGITQVSRIKEILKKRQNVAKIYNEELRDINGIELPYVAPWAKTAWFVYVIKLLKKYSRNKRDCIIKKMAKKGIQCADYFKPIHLQPFYRKTFGYKLGDFPIAENISSRTIALPFYNSLKKDTVRYIVKSLKEEIN